MIDIEPETVGKIIVAVIVLLGTALGGRSWLIRRTSKDGVVVATDSSQKDFLTVMREERDTLVQRLDFLTTERDKAMTNEARCMQELGGLRVQVEHMQVRIHEQATTILAQSTKIEALEKTVHAMRDHIDSLIGLRDANVNIVPGKPE